MNTGLYRNRRLILILDWESDVLISQISGTGQVVYDTGYCSFVWYPTVHRQKNIYSKHAKILISIAAHTSTGSLQE